MHTYIYIFTYIHIYIYIYIHTYIYIYTSRKIRKNYIKEKEKQLGDSDVYEELSDDPEPLISNIHRPIEKIRKRRELKKETIKYFEFKRQN